MRADGRLAPAGWWRGGRTLDGVSYRRADTGGGVGWVLVWPVAGVWWWLAGLPLSGPPRTGWPRVWLCAVRAAVLLVGGRHMMGEAGDPGWGTGLVLGCAAAGLVARSRRRDSV